MNLATTLELYAGGPGSGCNPGVGDCGRKATAQSNSIQDMLAKVSKQFPQGFSNWDKLYEFGHPGVVAPFTPEEQKIIQDIKQSVGNCRIGYCFMNAQRLAMASPGDPRVQYVEGLTSTVGVPIDHAWVEINGKVYDPTLMDSRGNPKTVRSLGNKSIGTPEYFGVNVPKNLIPEHQLSSRTYSQLTFDPKLQDKIWRKS